jgi:Co/Zn/Cd efflux system component
MSNPEAPTDDDDAIQQFRGSMKYGHTVTKSERKLTSAAVDERELNPKALGGSGIASSMRSNVVKSFRQQKSQGGYDEADPAQGLETLAISSVRAGNAVNIISQVLGDENEEADLKHFLCVPLTNNVKALFIMMCMFAAISLGQYFAAIAANSQSLKSDVVSMAMDAVSYFGNILGESSDVPSQRIVLQLFFSIFSLVLLNYFNTTILIESIAIVRASQEEAVDGEEGEGVEGKIVIAFAGLGLVFDAICLYAYYYYAKEDADIEYREMMRIAEAEGKNLEEAKAQVTKPEINMLTALLHVSADLLRSTVTFIEGILLLVGFLSTSQQEYVDSVCALIIGASIYLASIYALYEWVTSFWAWFSSLGDSIEVECPECQAMIEIKPDKAGHSKAADAFIA